MTSYGPRHWREPNGHVFVQTLHISAALQPPIVLNYGGIKIILINSQEEIFQKPEQGWKDEMCPKYIINKDMENKATALDLQSHEKKLFSQNCDHFLPIIIKDITIKMN